MCEPGSNELSSTLEAGRTIQPKSRILDENFDNNEKSILEGWCPKRGNEGLYDVNFDNPSYLDDDWSSEENSHSAFKNVLNNLSDGLALMHKKNIQQNGPKEAQPKKKTYRIKSLTTGQKAKKQFDDKSKIHIDEKNKENFMESDPEKEIPSLSNILDEANTSTKTPHDPSILNFKFDRQSTPIQENNFILVDASSKRNSYVKYDKNSDFIKNKDSSFLNTLEYNADLLKSRAPKSKPNENDYHSLIFSENEDKNTGEPKFEKILLPIKIKSAQRSTRTARSESQKPSPSMAYPKVLSPKDMLPISNDHVFIKRDATPSNYNSGLPKNMIAQKEFNFPSTLQRMEDLKFKKIKECEGFTEFAQHIISKRSSEVSSVRLEERNSIINAVMGKSFNPNNPNKAPPLFNLNLKGSRGHLPSRQLRVNDENSKEPLINISSINVDKSDYSLKPLDHSSIKKHDQKLKVNNQIDNSKILNSDLLEVLKERNSNVRDKATKPLLKSLHKKEVSHSSKRLPTNQDEKKVLVPGKININEIVF